MPQTPWEREAENWIKWARAPGHDSYWYYSESFFEAIVPPPGNRTLEVGCGEGRVARDLKARGHDVVGIDLVTSLLREARSSDGVTNYLRADAARLPFRDASFDLVVAYNSLMDFDDMPGAVREAARVLRPDGCLSICVVHPTRDAGAFASKEPNADFVISDTYFGPRPFKGTFERDGLTMTFEGWSYSLQDYFEAFEAADFVIERIREPVPGDDALTANPAWEQSTRIPMFLFMRGRKG